MIFYLGDKVSVVLCWSLNHMVGILPGYALVIARDVEINEGVS